MPLLGFSWNTISVITQLLVVAVALGGYYVTYTIFWKQEEHKYRSAVVINFNPRGDLDTRSDSVNSLGFRHEMRTDPTLYVDFRLDNVSDSPVTDVRMNFYLHDIETAERTNEQPKPFFKNDVLLIDGIAAKGSVDCKSQLSSRIINESFGYQDLFMYLIPPDIPSGTARLSRFTLVIKYKNLLDSSYFSAYKLDAQESQMTFLGAFNGDYLRDDCHHMFVANRGFPNSGSAPNWVGVRDTLSRINEIRSGRSEVAPKSWTGG
jgi:hypothetical protein